MSNRTKELENFKQDIRSYLIPLPKGQLLKRIDQDYYSFMGQNIPYRELGFCNSKELLQAVPDAARLEYRGNDLYVFAVSNAETIHVAKLVSKQKINNTGYPSVNRSNYGNRSYRNNYAPPPRMSQIRPAKQIVAHYLDLPKCVPGDVKRNIQHLLAKFPNGLNVDNFKLAFRKEYGFDINSQDFDYLRLNDFLKSLASEQILEMYEESNSYFVRLPQSRNLNKPQRDVEKPEEKIENDLAHDSEEQGDTDTWGTEPCIDEHVLRNLREIAENFPRGLPITELCGRYKEHCGCDLDLRNLGYNNVRELVNDLGNIFHVRVLADGECILMHPLLADQGVGNNAEIEGTSQEADIPENVQQNIYELLSYSTEGVLLSQFESVYKMNFNRNIPWRELRYQSLEKFLLALDFNMPLCIKQCGIDEFTVVLERDAVASGLFEPNPIIPEDAVLLDQGYSSLEIPDDDEYFSVCVGQVDSPGKIWLQVISETEYKNLELEELMDHLEDFYFSQEAEKYKVPEQYLVKGLNCAVLYPEENNWHRGCIIGKPGPVTYRMFYYDYGTVHDVDKSAIRLLKQLFAQLPAQAFCTRLANVKPLGTFFSVEASLRLLNLSFSKPLMVKVTSRTYMNTISVILCDTSGEEDIFLNDVLVNEGLVQACKDYTELRQPHSDDCIVPAPIGVPENSVLPSAPPISAFTPSSAPDMFHYSQVQTPREDLSAFSTNNMVSRSIATAPSYQADGPPRKLIDPEILKRAVERRKLLNFGSKEIANVPQATVEPLQHTVLKSPDLPTAASHSQHSLEPQIELPGQNITRREELYESSEDDDRQQKQNEPSTASSSVRTRNQLRFCKAVSIDNGAYLVHLINFYGQPCFTSADVSSFIFGIDIVKRILFIQKYPQCHIVATRSDHGNLFEELVNCGVSGDEVGMEKVVLYVLSDVLKIFDFLNVKKPNVIAEIKKLCLNFDAEDDYWKTKPEVEEDREKLEEKLTELREERKSLLHSMMDEDTSSKSKSERLLAIVTEMEDLKSKLSKFGQHSPKSASEQARIFLERVKLNSPDQKSDDALRNTPSPMEELTAAPAMPEQPLVSQGSFVPNLAQGSVAIAADQRTRLFMMSMGQPRFPVGVPPMMPPPCNPLVPVGIPQYYPTNYYPQVNLPMPSTGFTLRFPNNNMNFTQWQ